MTIVGVAGGLSVDHIVKVGMEPHYGCLGGPGLYSSLAAALLPYVQVRLTADIPADIPEFGDTLTAAGVDTTHCSSGKSAFTLWILNSPQGRRLVSTSPPPAVEIAADDELAVADQPITEQFLTGLDGLLLCAPSATDLPTSPPVVGIDPEQRDAAAGGTTYWDALGGPGRVLFPSRIHLRNIHPDVYAAAGVLATRLHTPIIARLDAEGVYLLDGDHSCWRIEDSKVQVVDTTGAGDAMAGATLAALAAGVPLPEAAALGVSAARLVLSDWAHVGLLCGPDHPGPSSMAAPLPGITITKE